MKTIYIEKQLKNHPRVKAVLSRFSATPQIIYCSHYQEVFNPNQQNFRIQKDNTSLILAEKQGTCVLPTPEGFGIGGPQNYYFSHMLNCLYDCRYCFLQGMYPSAYYTLFINYEQFSDSITALSKNCSQPPYFFSGYDGDSLAYEPVTGFLDYFIPFFQKTPHAYLELRTKSTNIRALLKHQPSKNIIAAFSFTPDEISKAFEHRVPPVAKRIAVVHKLAALGWPIGIRLDPLIPYPNFNEHYQNLIAALFENLPKNVLHSVSVGPLRFPQAFFQKIKKLYPEDKLFHLPFISRGKNVSFSETIENKMTTFVKQCLTEYVNEQKLFQCHNI